MRRSPWDVRRSASSASRRICGSIDVYANFGKIVSALGPNAASAYSLVDAVIAGTPYRFDVNVAGTTTALMSVAGVTLASGNVYTLYLLGSGATLQGVLTQDR